MTKSADRVEELERIQEAAWRTGTAGARSGGSGSGQVLELGAGERGDPQDPYARCDPEACKV